MSDDPDRETLSSPRRGPGQGEFDPADLYPGEPGEPGDVDLAALDAPDDPDAEPVSLEDYEPDGLEMATWIAHQVAAGAPRAFPRQPLRPRRRQVTEVTYSGSGKDERDPKLLGDVMNTVVARKGWTQQMKMRRLFDNWAELVGEANAQHSRPESFSDSVLVIRTDSTAWATALRQLSRSLLVRLNREVGQGSITRIEVKGPDAPSWSHGRRSVRGGRGPRDTYG